MSRIVLMVDILDGREDMLLNEIDKLFNQINDPSHRGFGWKKPILQSRFVRTTEDASHTDSDGEQVVSRKLYEALMDLYEVHKSGRCHYDHHGYCQTHYLHDEPCPVSVIADELAKQGRVGASLAGR